MEIAIGKTGLSAPKEYWALSPEQIGDLSNGCGPKGWGWLVPDRFRIIGLNFKPACDIHDFCYQLRIDRAEADRLFFDNLTIIARKSHTGPLGEWLAYIYYSAVRYGGSGVYNRKD